MDADDRLAGLYVEYGWPDRDGAPTAETRALVIARANGYCEWRSCRSVGQDVHHRLNRKAGGRSGASALRVNGPAALVVACRHHHDRVTSAYGKARTQALAYGWVLEEHQDPERTPIFTRHRPEPVWLLHNGEWWPTTLPHPIYGKTDA